MTVQADRAAAASISGAGVEKMVDSLAGLSRVLVAVTAQTLAGFDIELTMPQYRTLVVLAGRGRQRTVDLARELGVHSSTVTRACDRLIRKELVYREHGGPDRRVAWIALTEQGRDHVGEVMRRRLAVIRELVSAAEIDEPERLADFLDALVAASGELPERQWWQQWSTRADAALAVRLEAPASSLNPGV